MSFEAAKNYLIRILVILILIAIILLIVVLVISPGVSGQEQQVEFTQLCYEWRKQGCGEDEYYMIGPPDDPGRLQILCETLYPEDDPDDSQDICKRICLNNCNPLSGGSIV